MSVDERFWSKVAIAGPDECWEWMGGDNGVGYGRFWDGDRLVYAHRWAADALDAECVMHTCDNPPCCNPAHLVAGTMKENVADMHSKKRGNTGERNGMAKLTDADVHAIRAECAGGATQQSVADAYGIRQQHVSRIITGKRRAA